MTIRVHRRPVAESAEDESSSVTKRLSSWRLASRSVSSFLSTSRTSNLLVMCSEPGMGKTRALRALVSQARKSSTTHSLRLYGIDGLSASRRLARLARQVERECLSGGPVVVSIDDVPTGDDAIVDREASSILRMTSAGATVAVSLLPEDELLAERLADSVRVVSRDLLVRDVLELSPNDPLYDVRALTGGMPSLVSALLRDSGGPHSGALAAGSTYFEALEHLVGAALRPRLLDGEISTRLAMLLLGRGTFDDVASVTCVDPGEIAAGLEEFAPLFGVSCQNASFRCFGVDTIEGITACAAPLATKASAWSALFDSALRVLVERGEFGRAAIIARISPSHAAARVALGHAEEFIGMGEVGLIRRMIGPALARSLISPERAASVETVLSALGDTGFRLPEAWPGQGGEDAPCAADGQVAGVLLAGCRAVLAGGGVPVANHDVGRFTGLAVHLQAVQLLRDGRPSAAQRLVGPHVFSGLEGTLSAALLRLDMDIACVLLGGDGTGEGGLGAGAGEFLARDGYLAIRDEGALLLALDAVARGSCDRASIDALVCESERAGNELVRVAALMMGAAVEYVRGDYRNAGLRSAIAAGAAGRAGFTHLESEASVLCSAAAGSGLGLGAIFPDWGSACDTEGLSAVARLVSTALEGEGASQDVPRMLEGRPLPIDELWLLRVLTSGRGDVPERLRSLVPRSWAAALVPIPSPQDAPDAAIRPRGDAVGCHDGEGVCEAAPGTRLRLGLLGGFSLDVDGNPVPEWHIDRRAAKAMLVFVALHPRLSAKRYEIIEQLWPDCDYKAGLDRVYQATSTLRREVAAVAPGIDPFLSGRGDRAVSLDPELIECDYAEFAKAAGEALASEGDDAGALEAALRAERLYTGDLFVPTRDFTGYVVARRQELRELYADAVVAGAEAALRLGRYRISARLADAATAVDDLREDAVEVLIQALRAGGRMFEAEQRYRRYAVCFVDRTHMPPSKRLRKAAGGRGHEGGLPAHRLGRGFLAR
ncbi:MAG: hypothetical protein MR611_01505 [Coriobacteriaceae bacterium]|nr:hypothetical protein [Coriobacteriaceae bacterium]